MEFEWDEAKADGNFAKHGLTFARAIAVFADPGHVDEDSTQVGGESRRKAVGLIEGRLSTVVYTLRGKAVRVISARRASKAEKANYGNRQIHP